VQEEMDQYDGWCEVEQGVFEGRMKNARPTPSMLMKAVMLAKPMQRYLSEGENLKPY
jgi:hypothetical protein